MSPKLRLRLRSLRFRLPLILLLYCATVGVAIYLIVDRTQEERFEQEFEARQLARATELQERTERAAERSELDTAQREFGELAVNEALRGAVFVGPDNNVVLSSRRDWRGYPVDLGALGVAPVDRARVEQLLAETHQTHHTHSLLTNDGDGLVLLLPASLPLQRGQLEINRSAAIVFVYDLSLSKAINAYRLRQLFLLIAGAVVLGVVLLGVVLHIFVTRRLEFIQELIGRFAAGETLSGSPSRMSDEIGAIGSRFQEMARAVRHEMAERLDATAALRASENKFRTAMHSSPIGQALVGADGRLFDVNPALCQILGYSEDELLSMSFREVTHPDDLEESNALNAKIAAGALGSFRIEKRYIHKNGNVVWGQLNAAVVWKGDRPEYYVCQVEDVTERRRAEERLQRVNRTLLAISHCNQVLVHATDEASLLEQVCRVVVEDGGFKMAWVGFLRGDRVFAAARWGVDDGYIDGIIQRWHQPDGLAAPRRFLASGKPGITNDYLTEPTVKNWRDLASQCGFRSSASMPLKEDDRTFGALMVYSDQPDVFDAEEVAMLSEMTDDLAYGIQALRTRTRRERAEEELRESQSRLTIAMDMAKLAPWEYDFANDEFVFNDKFYALLGTTAEAEGGLRMGADQYARKFLMPEDIAMVREEIDRGVSTTDPKYTNRIEHRFRRADGSIGYMLVRKAIVKDEHGRSIRSYGVNQDITERRLAEDAMRAMNERYARHEQALAMLTRCHVQSPEQLPEVLETVTEIVAATLETNRVSVWRRTAPAVLQVADLFEWPANRHTKGAELKGEPLDDFVRMLADSDVMTETDALSDGRTRDFVRQYMAANDISSFFSVPVRVQGGMTAVFMCSQVGEPRRWTPDEQTFAVAVANLLSSLFSQVERLHLEAQLRQATKLEGIGQLAGGVAHDFNNVLTVILGKAGQLADDPRMPNDLREASEEITQSADRAANLTRQLLAFSRRQAMQVRDLDLNVVIRSVGRMLERILGEDLVLELVLAPEPIHIRADAGMIDQVVLNLAVNARDAMRHGGQLVVETAVVDVDPSTSRRASRPSGPYAVLRVRDNGSGIPPEHLPHIFEPFFTTKDVGKGTGLGLATTYGIVQQHNGWIEVESEVGRGTTFSIYLPSFTQPVPETIPVAVPVLRAPVPAAAPGHETILVVEDEDEVRSLIVDALSNFGYRVLEAGSGPEAIDVWRQHGPNIDLLITDMVMPGGMNGLDLASQFRSDNAAVRIIYISGYLADVSQDDLSQSEGASYLAKPFTLPALARLVRQTLDVVPQQH